MSVESVLARVAALELALANPTALLSASATTGGTAAPSEATESAPEAASAPGGSSFAQALQSATASYGAASAANPAATTATSYGTPTSALAGTTDAALTSTDPTLTGSTSSVLASPADGAATGTGLASPATAAYPATATPGVTGVASLGAPSPLAGGQGYGARIVAIAESQAGQAEEPLGSNEGAAVAEYRTATAGAIPGAPWCAYFASWVARQAGEPLGAHGEGLGAVSEIWSWAQSTGRAITNGPGVTPKPGDLIVFGDEHVGIVKDVLPDGDIQTIEGNYENKVALNTRTPTEATGYVNME